MNTKFVGVKEFRQNIAGYAKKARTNKTQYVIMSHKKPLFSITPFDEDADLDSFFDEIQEGRNDVVAGRIHSQAEILAEFAK
jgi:PHD/YefM family antitoxin component YafN of YafNO toxin-antitoxin module